MGLMFAKFETVKYHKNKHPLTMRYHINAWIYNGALFTYTYQLMLTAEGIFSVTEERNLSPQVYMLCFQLHM